MNPTIQSTAVLETIRTNVKKQLAAVGMDMKAASRAAGLSETTVRDTICRPRKFGPSIVVLAALCGPLNCELADLVTPAPADEGETAPEAIYAAWRRS